MSGSRVLPCSNEAERRPTLLRRLRDAVERVCGARDPEDDHRYTVWLITPRMARHLCEHGTVDAAGPDFSLQRVVEPVGGPRAKPECGNSSVARGSADASDGMPVAGHGEITAKKIQILNLLDEESVREALSTTRGPGDLSNGDRP